jgi:hypothetical protein
MFSRLTAVIAVGVLAVSGLATSTANAATTPTVTAVPECGKVTITVHPEAVATKAPFIAEVAKLNGLHLFYEVDRRRHGFVPVSTTADTVKVIDDFREDSGVHWVRYRLSDARQWSDRIRVESDCRPNFERAESPTVAQPECDTTLGKLTIPSDRGVFYRVSRDGERSRVVRAGEYNVRPGVYRVTAHAVRGHVLRGDDRWRLVIEAAEACPTPTPTPTVTATPTEEPTATPTPDPTLDPEPEPTVTETETEEPAPAPTVTNRQVIVINDMRVPDRVDTGLGWLATK